MMFDIPITRSSTKPISGVPSGNAGADFGGPKGGLVRIGGDAGIGPGFGDAGRVGERRVEGKSIVFHGQEDDDAGVAQGVKEKNDSKGGPVGKDYGRDKNR
jgi:hypothetical protein